MNSPAAGAIGSKQPGTAAGWGRRPQGPLAEYRAEFCSDMGRLPSLRPVD